MEKSEFQNNQYQLDKIEDKILTIGTLIYVLAAILFYSLLANEYLLFASLMAFVCLFVSLTVSYPFNDLRLFLGFIAVIHSIVDLGLVCRAVYSNDELPFEPIFIAINFTVFVIAVLGNFFGSKIEQYRRKIG